MKRLRHNRDFFKRVIFFVILYVIYFQLLRQLNLPMKWIGNSVFGLLMLVNYLVDSINIGGNRYFFSNSIYLTIVNVIVFVTYYSFTKEIGFLKVGGLFYISQIVVAYGFGTLSNPTRRVAILGNSSETVNIEGSLSRSSDLQYVGIIDESKSLEEEIDSRDIGMVILMKEVVGELAHEVIKAKLRGVKVQTYLDFLEEVEGRIHLDRLSNNWIIKSSGFELLNSDVQQRIKRTIDLIATFMVGMVALPIMAVAAVIVKLESKGPVIFSQERAGLGGETFTIYKFRSMYLHDEDKHSKYAGKDDSRITKFGKIMRKTRIDELPQLYNVLMGDMSFVGPRAEWIKLHNEYDKQIPYYYLRGAVKTGLTGWAQVMYPYGENLEDTKKKLEYDLYYIKYQSFILDIIIIFKTVKTVLFRKGR